MLSCFREYKRYLLFWEKSVCCGYYTCSEGSQCNTETNVSQKINSLTFLEEVQTTNSTFIVDYSDPLRVFPVINDIDEFTNGLLSGLTVFNNASQILKECQDSIDPQIRGDIVHIIDLIRNVTKSSDFLAVAKDVVDTLVDFRQRASKRTV
jgi:hypothetical protein